MSQKKKKKGSSTLDKITSVALTIMALIVSIIALVFSSRQNKIDLSNNQPNIEIHKSLGSFSNNGFYDYVELLIINRNNGVVKNLNISTRKFLNIEIQSRDILNKESDLIGSHKFFLLDQLDYYNFDSENVNSSILAKITTPKVKYPTEIDGLTYSLSQEERYILYNYLLNNELHKRNLFLLQYEKELWIQIKYINFLDKEIVEYFKIKQETIAYELMNRLIGFDYNDFNTKVLKKEIGDEIFQSNDKLNYISFKEANSSQYFIKKIFSAKKTTFNNIEIVDENKSDEKLNFKLIDSLNNSLLKRFVENLSLTSITQ